MQTYVIKTEKVFLKLLRKGFIDLIFFFGLELIELKKKKIIIIFLCERKIILSAKVSVPDKVFSLLFRHHNNAMLYVVS